jgi:putative AlgH/UPF0301 family transcriptional regulator
MKTFDDVMVWATKQFPYAIIQEDTNGELLIAIGYKQGDNGELVEV